MLRKTKNVYAEYNIPCTYTDTTKEKKKQTNEDSIRSRNIE